MWDRDRRQPRGCTRLAGLSAITVLLLGLMAASALAASGQAGSGSNAATAPTAGSPPPVNLGRPTRRITGVGKRTAAHKPAPALTPAVGRVIKTSPPLVGNPEGKAEFDGRVHLGPPNKGARPLLVPAPPARQPARAPGLSPATPIAAYSSTQLDHFSAECGFGANETTIAQSSDNPNLVVAGANTYYDNSGNCQDSHAGVYYSADGGQHWRYEVMPGLIDPSSGDPGVIYDAKDHVFLYSFIEFNRNDSTQGRVGVEASTDGVSWSRNTTLDSNSSAVVTDKPSIAVDQNPSSPHYGRVAVAWTEFQGSNSIYQEDYTDNGGASWSTSGSSVNFTSHECGNGTSEAFNANGELMIAWADCSGGVNSMYEELSTSGGAGWTAPADVQITTTNPIESAGDDDSAGCFLDNGGTDFRCNSFPSLAGDPNSGDAGGTAFIVTWADVRSTTQTTQTVPISQIMGLSTADDGSTWGHLAFISSNDFGDKFFPAASFAPNGRLTVSFSSRENDAGPQNPNGKAFNEHQTEAGGLSSLRAGSYVTYTTDSTLGDPGSLVFIGDYSGNSSLDANFDTFPIWTDLRNGFPSIRTQDLCYLDCMSALPADTPLAISHGSGTTFTDLWSFSMDPQFGSGWDFWNVVGIRPDTSADDDTSLSSTRYYQRDLASSAFGTGSIDYVLVNGNATSSRAFFPSVNSFSGDGGSYSIEWVAGNTTLATANAGGMLAADLARIYDALLTSGTTYHFGLRPSTSTTASYSLQLHSASRGVAQGRASAVVSSGTPAPGSPAFVQYDTGTDPTQFDALLALNTNGGQGDYTIYRDTASPSGTIKLDGGAKSTNNTHLTLALHATNPTAGDPVSDMAFSVNGGAFGAWRPYATSANVTVPTGDGLKSVTVEYRNGAGATSTATASIYLIQHPPTVTSLNPNNGSPAGGNTVVISGTKFAPGATVKFGSTASALVSFVNANQLKARVPAHAIGTVHVIVTTAEATSTATGADKYAYGLPTVTSLAPNGGSIAGGNTVTITGTNFTSTMTVNFGPTASPSVTFVSSQKIKAKAPAHAAGSVHVHVLNAAGTSATGNADLYTYGAPMVTSISPNAGPTGGANTVTINGKGFTSAATVSFGPTTASTVTFVSATQLKAKAPARPAGTVHVIVHTPGGTSTAANQDEYAFGAPTITSLDPASGRAAGGNTVTIKGTGFAPGATVGFGQSKAGSVTFVGSTQLKAKAPAHAAGTVHVSVRTAAGAQPAAPSNAYVYKP
jgi:hypothetical protein